MSEKIKWLRVLEAVRGAGARRAKLVALHQREPSLQGEARRAGAGPSGEGLRGSHPCVQIPDGVREGKYGGARLLSAVPSEGSRGNGHKQGIM